MSRVAAIVLAAGEGRRMGGRNKLLAELDGRSLVRRVAEAVLASRARPLIVVTGHDRDALVAALAGLQAEFVFNPDYVGGLSTSLKRGLAAVPESADGALVLLADMPLVSGPDLDRSIGAFSDRNGGAIVVPTHRGQRGNPVLWPRPYFAELMAVEGDKGGRDVLARNSSAIVNVEMDEAILVDFDTPEALAKAGGLLIPRASKT